MLRVAGLMVGLALLGAPAAPADDADVSMTPDDPPVVVDPPPAAETPKPSAPRPPKPADDLLVPPRKSDPAPRYDGPEPACDPFSAPAAAPLGATFPCDFPDPMVMRAGSTYFAYGTSVKWTGVRHAFPILRSTDLRHWTYAGDAFGGIPSWAAGELWAPSVVATRRGYVLHYSALRRSDGNHCIAVATASSPAGPFQDRGVVRCRSSRSAGFIDPAVLVDRGKAYLYFSVDGPAHEIAAVALDRSLLRARGPVTRVLARRNWHTTTVEAPWPVRRGGRYYLLYSSGSWRADYRMRWAVARSPLGPFRDLSRTWTPGGLPLEGPGGGSLVDRPDGSTAVAFHAWTGPADYDLGGIRTLRTAAVRWATRGPVLAP